MNVGDYFVCKRKSGFGTIVKVLRVIEDGSPYAKQKVEIETVSSSRKAVRIVLAETFRRNYRPAEASDWPAGVSP